MFLALVKRVLALACALSTVALTAGLSPQAAARQRTESVPPATLGPDDVSVATELARLHPGTGAMSEGLVGERPAGGLVHVVGAGQSLRSIAIEYRVGTDELLDANGFRRPGQVRQGVPLRIPGARPLSAAPMAGGGEFTYRASEEDHFPWGWCTWYVAQRRDVPWRGDARTWVASARALGWPTGQTPEVGAMMVTNEGYWYGHVAYVEKVNPDGSWLVSEMNYAQWGAVDLRLIRPASKVPVIGFVY